MYPAEIDEPTIGDVAEYLTKFGVTKRLEERNVVVPAQTLNFCPDEIISSGAFISHMEAADLFWIQPQPQEVDDIMESIEVIAAPATFINGPELKGVANGTAGLAFFPSDEQWYRAVVEGSDAEGNVHVNYIDFGNSGTVTASQLREMPPALAQYPAMAFKCCLDAIETLDEHCIQEFINSVPEVPLAVKLIRLTDATLTVRLYHADGTDVIDSLKLSLRDSDETVAAAGPDLMTFDEDMARGNIHLVFINVSNINIFNSNK